MRKPRIYLETTIWNFYFADDAPEKKKATLEFFAQISHFQIYISNLVLDEIMNTPDESKRQALLELINQHQPMVLAMTEEAQILSERYIAAGILTQNHLLDAIHIAIAAVGELDMILSWNMRHIVRLKTRQGVKALNLLHGYREIEIINPQEVIEYEPD